MNSKIIFFSKIIILLKYCILAIFTHFTPWDRLHIICLYSSVREPIKTFQKTCNASNKKMMTVQDNGNIQPLLPFRDFLFVRNPTLSPCLKKDLDMLHCGIVENMFSSTQVIFILNGFLADMKCRILAFFNHKEGTVHGKSKEKTDIRA